MKCWCNATIGSTEPEIKSHVKSCNYYLKRCFFYNCIDRIPPEASVSDMKVVLVLQQLMLAELKLVEDVLSDRIRKKSSASRP